MKNQPEIKVTVRELYPTATEEQLRRAERNLRAYVELMIAIAADLREDPEACQLLRSLTGKRQSNILSSSTPQRSNNKTNDT